MASVLLIIDGLIFVRNRVHTSETESGWAFKTWGVAGGYLIFYFFIYLRRDADTQQSGRGYGSKARPLPESYV